MAQSPRRVDLRLTIPAAAPFDALAAELAGKFAVYSGAREDASRGLAEAVAASITPLAEASPHASVHLEMSARDRELVVTVNSGTTKKLTCPLPD